MIDPEVRAAAVEAGENAIFQRIGFIHSCSAETADRIRLLCRNNAEAAITAFVLDLERRGYKVTKPENEA